MIEQLREDDVIIIWKLDCLGRSQRDLVNLVIEIQTKGAGLKSLNDSIDTSTPHGKLTFYLFAALAEFERDIIRERTKGRTSSSQGQRQERWKTKRPFKRSERQGNDCEDPL